MSTTWSTFYGEYYILSHFVRDFFEKSMMWMTWKSSSRPNPSRFNLQIC